jgi:CHAT domain-containing protein
VEAIAALFPRADTLLGPDASEERLDRLVEEQRLQQYRYLHLATHGVIYSDSPLQSFLALSQSQVPDALGRIHQGKAPPTGQLTAAHSMQSWHLNADVVTLSACRSGLGQYQRGEGYLGFAQALFLAGGRTLVLGQWSVDDTATALLMTRFYQNLLGKRPGLAQPLSKAEALHEAKDWLRRLTDGEIKERVAMLPRGPERARAVPAAPRPFAHPYYWAGFVLVGDPG